MKLHLESVWSVLAFAPCLCGLPLSSRESELAELIFEEISQRENLENLTFGSTFQASQSVCIGSRLLYLLIFRAVLILNLDSIGRATEGYSRRKQNKEGGTR